MATSFPTRTAALIVTAAGATVALSLGSWSQCPTHKLYGGASLDISGGARTAINGATLVLAYSGDDTIGTNQGSALVYVRVGDDWVLETTLVAGDAMPGDFFGTDVALQGDTVLISAHPANEFRGAVYTFERTGSGWTQTAKLEAPDAEIGASFGWSVALDRDLALIGAPFDEAGLLGSDYGAVYAFERGPSGWAFVQKFRAADTAPGDEFGYSISLAGDKCLIGAPEDDGPVANLGAAYVFRRVGGQWSEGAKLVMDFPSLGAGFGTSVSLSGDLALVGAPYKCTGDTCRGVAYVFANNPAGWHLAAKLEPPDLEGGDGFGTVVLQDGVHALVAAPFSDEAGGNAGAVYLFGSGATGIEQLAKLTPLHFTLSDNHFDQFGMALALDGDAAFIGAPGDDPPGPASGTAFLYSLAGEGCPALFGDGETMPFEQSVHQLFGLNAGEAHAGKLYLLLGSLGGTEPGIPVDAGVLPLNPGRYFDLTLASPNTPPLEQSFGVLDAQGLAQARFSVPGGIPPALLGSTVHHAYAVLDPATGAVPLASDAVPLLLVF